MTSRIERVLSAITHHTDGPLPKGELTIDVAFVKDFLRWQGRAQELENLSETDLIMECSRSLGQDLICIQSDNTIGAKFESSRSLKAIETMVRSDFFVFWVVNGTFQISMDHFGMTDLMMDIFSSPGKVGDQLRQLSEQVTATMIRGIDSGAQGVILADDIAYQRGTYVSPRFIEQYLLPLWGKQVSAAKRLNVPVFFHSDGNLNAILPSIVEAGFDGLQCIEPTAGMDIAAIKRTYGKNLCLMGNIDPALLSASGCSGDVISRKEKLRRAVMDLLACDDGHGGLIIGTCSGLHAGLSAEYVDFMYQLVSNLEVLK